MRLCLGSCRNPHREANHTMYIDGVARELVMAYDAGKFAVCAERIFYGGWVDNAFITTVIGSLRHSQEGLVEAMDNQESEMVGRVGRECGGCGCVDFVRCVGVGGEEWGR
ncbi:hypothetical protein Tco_0743532 [Tanacetum coccineum]